MCREIVLPKDYLSQIGKEVAALLDYNPSSDILCQFLSVLSPDQDTLQVVSDYLINTKASIFEYQNYMLWKLLIYSEFSTPVLIEHAQNIIFTNDSLPPDIAGALLYLGRFGDERDRESIVRQIKESHVFKNFFVQRHAIIAIQELEYEKVSTIQEHIHEENLEVYRCLHEQDRHYYAIPLPDIQVSELLHGVSIYV
jgi:hypothetical protein